ncbi:hypothetical protein HBI38_053210 [Parastagonospora nodorum]|nr:hypothetical protein HBI38_053210 [Parastagonospora nodorum]
MSSKRCAHKDLRMFGDTMCCLSCGLVRDMGPAKVKFENEATTATNQTGPGTRSYTYQTLSRDRDEIRLLKLLPDDPLSPASKQLLQDSAQSPILRCQLIRVELEKAPPYVALSYTWATEDGDVGLTRCIIVHSAEETEYHSLMLNTEPEEVLHITVNCEDAVRQTRNSSITEFVWVDAICIDQNRISERNHQVSIMDRIYTTAASVEVCIQSQERFYDVIDLLDGEDFVTEINYGWRPTDMDSWPGMKRLDDFLRLRYFSRVWVRSFAPSAKRETDKYLLQLGLAKHAILRVNDRCIPFPEKAFKQLHKMYSTQRKRKHRLSQWASLLERDANIISCLHASMNSSASDSRDKVFAITGLLKPDMRAMISIDYMSTVDEIFAQAVLACIVDCQDLEILCYASLPASPDHVKAPVFTVHEFQRFIAHKVCERRVDRDRHFVVERSEGLIPTGQILPRLMVRAHFLDACVESTSDGFGDCITNGTFGENHSSWSPAIISMWEKFGLAFQSLNEVWDFAWLHESIWDMKDRSSSQDWSGFRTEYSIGFTSGHCLPGDAIATVDGLSRPFLLRMVDTGCYRLVGTCVLWATRKFADSEQVDPSQAWVSDDIAMANGQASDQHVEVVVY